MTLSVMQNLFIQKQKEKRREKHDYIISIHYQITKYIRIKYVVFYRNYYLGEPKYEITLKKIKFILIL